MVRAPSPPKSQPTEGPCQNTFKSPASRIKHALPVAQATEKGAASLLAQNITVRLAPLADRLLDDGGKPPRDGAEEPVPRIDQFARRESLLRIGRRRRLSERRVGLKCKTILCPGFHCRNPETCYRLGIARAKPDFGR